MEPERKEVKLSKPAKQLLSVGHCQEWERVGARIEPSTILERQQSAVKVCVKLETVHKKLR